MKFQLYKPGDTFTWNGMQVVVKHPYEMSVLCTQVGRTGGIFGVHVSEIPCPSCGGHGSISKGIITQICDLCTGTGSYQQVINNVNQYEYGTEIQTTGSEAPAEDQKV